MPRVLTPLVLLLALAGCGRIGFQHVPNQAPSGDAAVDASGRLLEAGVPDAGSRDVELDGGAPLDAGAPEAGPRDAEVDGGALLDGGTCEGGPELIEDFGITLQMTVMSAAEARTMAGAEDWEADSIVFGASACFDPVDPVPLMDALEAELTGRGHPILDRHRERWFRPSSEVARSELHFPGDDPAVQDAADAWGDAPGRYYSDTVPTLPCAGCEGSVSISYIVYPARGRIGVLIGGMVR